MASHALLALRDTVETIPAGSLPVRVGSHAQGLSVDITCIVFMVLSWLTVLFRLYTRAVLVRNIGADDYFVLTSVIFFTVYNVACIVCAGATMGDVYLRVDSAGTAFNWLLVAESFYVVTMCALKISVSIFFLRVMIKPWQRWVVYASVGLATSINLAYFFIIVFQCGVPSGGMWFLLRQLSKKCLTAAQFLGVSYTHGAICSVTDIIFAILPVAMLRSSKLHSRERITVFLILMLAAVGGVASMVRLNFVSRLATSTTSWFADANLIAIWSAIEPGLGIIASSLATLRPLFRNCLFNVRSTGGSSLTPYADGRFQTLKSEHKVEELHVHKDELHLSDLQFLEGGFGPKTSPGPHQHIEKDPWRPGGRGSMTNSPIFDKPDMAKLHNQRSLERAEEFLGEVFSSYPLPRYGNSVKCEGPYEEIQEQSPAPRCRSNSRLRGLHRG